MPTAPYGELARQAAITSRAGAVHVSKPLPVKVPGTAEAATSEALAVALVGTMEAEAVEGGASSAPRTAARAAAPVLDRHATFMATSAPSCGAHADARCRKGTTMSVPLQPFCGSPSDSRSAADDVQHR